MDNFSRLVYERFEDVEGVGPWHWLSGDFGAWDGPSTDFAPIRDQVVLLTPNRRRVCVQAGGCQGMYPRLWSGLFERVYTFEPDAKNFHVLCMNNQTENVFKFNCALGEGTMVGIDREWSHHNAGMHRTVGEGHVPALRLDDLHLDACDFIQLDVEGYEVNALRGAAETIRAHRPVVSVETFDAQVAEVMEGLGYRVHGKFGPDHILVPA